MNIKELVEKLIKCDYQYTLGDPIITDVEYDNLRDQLYKLDPKNKYFKLIGCEVTDNCVKLPYHLGSQTKIKEDKDLQKWIKKYNTNDYIISEKLDGISAYYNKAENKLYTRGNGKTGSDISHILQYINLPIINTDIVRGELLISKKNWKEEYGSNPRNVVAGLVNAKTFNIKLLKLVDLVIYQVIDKSIKMEDQLKLITKNRVKYNVVLEPLTINNLKVLLNTYKASSEYEIDGIVVTDNSKAYSNIKTGNPDFAFAFKNAELDESAITTVIDVEYKLSKDNRYKPRVLFNKVKLDQVYIECASGYNAKFILDNGIGIGAKIRIVRSGQVIPKIIEVIKKADVPKMPDGDWEWDFTSTDAMFVKKSDEESPKEQRVGRSVHFFKTLGIKNLAEGTIIKLYDNGFKSLESLLDIKDPNELKNIAGIGDKKIEVIINCIKEALDYKDLQDIMAASNIFERSLGSKKLKLIIMAYDDIMNDNISIDHLMTVKGIGKVNAEQFILGFNDFKVFYNKYYKSDKVVKVVKDPEKLLDKRLIGKSVSFTGVRNKDLEKLIEKYDGKVLSTVTKSVDVLITKDINSTSGSMKKAKELNILIIEYDKLLML